MAGVATVVGSGATVAGGAGVVVGGEEGCETAAAVVALVSGSVGVGGVGSLGGWESCGESVVAR